MKPARAGPRRRPASQARPPLSRSPQPPPPDGACGRATAPAPAARGLGQLPSRRVRLTHCPLPGSAPPLPARRARPRPGDATPRGRPPPLRGSRGPPSSQSWNESPRGLCFPAGPGPATAPHHAFRAGPSASQCKEMKPPTCRGRCGRRPPSLHASTRGRPRQKKWVSGVGRRG